MLKNCCFLTVNKLVIFRFKVLVHLLSSSSVSDVCLYPKICIDSRGVTILQMLDSIQFSILRSRLDSILDFHYHFFQAQVAMPFLD